MMITRRKVLSVFAGLPLFGGLFAGKVAEGEDVEVEKWDDRPPLIIVVKCKTKKISAEIRQAKKRWPIPERYWTDCRTVEGEWNGTIMGARPDARKFENDSTIRIFQFHGFGSSEEGIDDWHAGESSHPWKECVD